MKEEKNIYVGNRYVPKIIGEWNRQEPYEGLSIVTFEGTSYTSKKGVPIGVDIINENYWSVTGNYNAQIENYRQEVKKNSKDLTDYKGEITTLLAEKANDADLTDVVVNINKFPKLTGELDDTKRFQRLINHCQQYDSVAYIPNTITVSDTILVNGGNKSLKIRGRGWGVSIIKFLPSSLKPFFAIKNGRTDSPRDIIYDANQTVSNGLIENIQVTGDSLNSIFSKNIVWSETKFLNVSINKFYQVFLDGGFLHLSYIDNSTIYFIRDSVFYNVMIIDVWIKNNYLSGMIQTWKDGTKEYGYYPDLMKNIPKFTNSDFSENWVEFFINVFPRADIGTRIKNNNFDFIVRLVENMTADCDIQGNRFSNYHKENIRNNIEPRGYILDSTKFEIEFYLIKVWSRLKVVDNTFYHTETTTFSPVFKFFDLYGNNKVENTKISGNNYVGYSYDYHKIMFPQIANNPKVEMLNSVIDEWFVITDMTKYVANQYVENVLFRNGNIVVRSANVLGVVELYHFNGTKYTA